MTIQQVPDNETPAIVPFDEDEGLSISGEQSFDQFGSQLPTDARSFLEDASPASSPSTPEGETLLGSSATFDDAEVKKTKRIKMSRKMQKAMDRLKKKTAQLPIMYFHSKAKDHPEWELDAEETELIEDAFSTVFEILDIEIQIEAVNWTLTSIYWVLSYPVLAFVFLFLTKKALVIDKENRERGITE